MNSAPFHFRVIDHFATFSETMKYINGMSQKYPFSKETQPEAWVQRMINFTDFNSFQVIEFIVKSFKSSNPICYELSDLYGAEMRLIDALYIFIDNYKIDPLFYKKHTDYQVRVIRLITQLEVLCLELQARPDTL